MPELTATNEISPEGQVVSHLFRSALQFRRLLEKLPAGAYTCDPDGLITYFNPHAVQIWGRAPLASMRGRLVSKEAGFDYHLVKPLNLPGLLGLLEEIQLVKNPAS